MTMIDPGKYKWTPTQCEILAEAIRRGEAGTRCRGPGETNAGFKLHQAGFGEFVSCPGDSRFYANDAGRAAVHAATVHAEVESARYLGNGNEALERGDRKKAERLFERSGEWLDAANHLRKQGST